MGQTALHLSPINTLVETPSDDAQFCQLAAPTLQALYERLGALFTRM